MKKRPKRLVVLSKQYTVTYCKRQCGVNPDEPTEAVSALIDMEKGTIRIYDGGRPWNEIMTDLLHEIMHAICAEMGGPLALEQHHDDLNRMSTCIADTLHRNGLLAQ